MLWRTRSRLSSLASFLSSRPSWPRWNPYTVKPLEYSTAIMSSAESSANLKVLSWRIGRPSSFSSTMCEGLKPPSFGS